MAGTTPGRGIYSATTSRGEPTTGSAGSVLEQAFPQPRERPREQPGHVHLRDPDLGRDLGLRHATEEP